MNCCCFNRESELRVGEMPNHRWSATGGIGVPREDASGVSSEALNACEDHGDDDGALLPRLQGGRRSAGASHAWNASRVDQDRRRHDPKSSANDGLTEFVVTVTRKPGQPLGLMLSKFPHRSLMVRKVYGELIGEWNMQRPQGALDVVKPGDLIMEVNGVAGTCNALLELLAQHDMLNIMFLRPT
eukprot:NODE_14598_length_1098_cov_7.365602.p1 GENE.NODE_14598_length_1098_cov_7.365602~~NODE_14598_length_1098_cov_7.365602.p1  ORF type:complete len:185 (+),score=14.25 NODE_14598_length_1098_cov_7.365602:230-784(+)